MSDVDEVPADGRAPTEDGRRVSTAMAWSLPEGINTPALVVDLDTLTANVRVMAAHMHEHGVALRPHAKTHKSVDVARLQLTHGAAGLTVASISEAEVFAAAGFDDLFIAYPVFASEPKARRLDALAAQARVSVGVDSVEGAVALSSSNAARSITVLVEIDSGQHRTGVPPADAGKLAARCCDLGLDVAGVFTHGGHGYHHLSAPLDAARDERAALELAVEALRSSGIRARTVSAGSTPTAVNSARAPVTEERPGSYVFNDRQQMALGSATREGIALAIVATVVSTSVSGQAVVDAGSKALGTDRLDWMQGYGVIPELSDAPVVSLSECHGVVALGNRPRPAVGSVVRIIPNHVCPVVNLYDRYQIVSDGRRVDQWEISARGCLE